MATREIDIIKTRTARLSKEEKVELIDYVTKSLANGGESTGARSSVTDILKNAKPPKHPRTAAEIDEYLRKERDSWDD